MKRLVLVLALVGCVGPVDPRIEDPCYAMKVWTDAELFVPVVLSRGLPVRVLAVTGEWVAPDSITYEWTPGACD